MGRHGTERDGVSSAPCAACSLQWKGQEILQMGAEKGCSPTHLFSETPEILPAKQNMSEERHGACWHLLRLGMDWGGMDTAGGPRGCEREMQQLVLLTWFRLWMAPLAPRTPLRSASRANASRRAVTGSWAPRRSSTNAASAEGTIRAARRSRACSPNPCECLVTTCASPSPSSALWCGGCRKVMEMVMG